MVDWNYGLERRAVVGRLELIVGPMRSNKTAELLRRIEIRRQYAKQDVLLLKPSADTKAASGLVESRNANGCGKMEAVEFPYADVWSAMPILEERERRTASASSVWRWTRGSSSRTCFCLRRGCWRAGTT